MLAEKERIFQPDLVNIEALRQGEDWAKPIIEETIDYLAIGIAGVVALLDPELIILGGGVAGSADVFIEPILDRIKGAIPIKPKLIASKLGNRAVVLETITSVLHNTFAKIEPS